MQKVSGLPKGVLGSGECMLAVNRHSLLICTAEFHVRKSCFWVCYFWVY